MLNLNKFSSKSSGQTEGVPAMKADASDRWQGLTYLTTKELSGCIKNNVLLEGQHYIKQFGGRKTL